MNFQHLLCGKWPGMVPFTIMVPRANILPPKTSTATPSPALQTASATGNPEDASGNTAIIWICGGAAAVILVGTIIFAIAHRKKKS